MSATRSPAGHTESPGAPEELPGHVLEDAWDGEGLLADLLDGELPEVRELLGEGDREQIHRYVGARREAVAAGGSR